MQQNLTIETLIQFGVSGSLRQGVETVLLDRKKDNSLDGNADINTVDSKAEKDPQ